MQNKYYPFYQIEEKYLWENTIQIDKIIATQK